MNQDALAVTRLVTSVLEELEIPYVIGGSLAGAVLAKLEWYQQGGEVSDRQWRDIIGIARTQQETLNFAYIAEQAAEMGTLARYQRLCDQLQRHQGA